MPPAQQARLCSYMSMFIQPLPSLYRRQPEALPIEVWEYRLSPYTITLLAYFMALEVGPAMSSRTMAKNLGISRQRIEDSLDELQRLNIVSVEKIATSPRRLVNRYSVCPSNNWLHPGRERASSKIEQEPEVADHQGMVPWI